MQNEWWKVLEGKLAERKWPEIRDGWLEHIDVKMTQNSVPVHRIAELPAIGPAIDGMKDKSERCVPPLAGLKAAVWVEGLWLYRKAVNALAGAEVHVDAGLCSWATSSAYHAAFFSMKAIQHFLGVAQIEANGKSHVIDVWTEPFGISKSAIRRGEKPQPAEFIYRTGKHRMDHQPLWALFQRLLRVTKGVTTIWPVDIVDAIDSCAPQDFAYFRNRLHYETFYWPFAADLSQCVVNADCRNLVDVLSWDDRLNPDVPKFTIALGLTLTWMCAQMVADIAKLSVIVQNLNASTLAWHNDAVHTLYREVFHP